MTPPPVGELVARRYELRGAPRQFPGYTGYRAFDREVEVEVALWWIRRELYPTAADRAAFLRAADGARAMRNHNARRLFDAGEVDGGLFATVQLAAHQPRVGAPSDAELLELAVALCSALGRAHDDGFVHGRLVPDDVVHVNGLLKIGGIGLWGTCCDAARQVWGEAGRYVAPEAWSRAGATPSADVFSAAVILAELACGGGSAWHRSGDVRNLAAELARARADVAAELGGALALDPAQRPSSMPALLDALHRVLADERLPATPPLAPVGADAAARGGQPLVAAPLEVRAIDGAADASADTRNYVKPTAAELAPRAADVPRADPPEDATTPFVREPGAPLRLPLAAGPPSARMPAVSLSLPAARRDRGLLPYALAGLAAAVGVGLIVWVTLVSYFGRDGGGDGDAGPAVVAVDEAWPARAAAAAVEPVVVAPAPASGPCPPGMAQVEQFCIDAFESPGEGRLPEAGMTLADAERACVERGARLCEPEEWERACRGPGGASFPYGSAYRRDKCNTDEGGRGAVAAGGSLRECRSVEGIYDLSGNVAEWVAGGRPRGGSAHDGTDGRCSRQRRAKQGRGYSDVGFRCCADVR